MVRVKNGKRKDENGWKNSKSGMATVIFWRMESISCSENGGEISDFCWILTVYRPFWGALEVVRARGSPV
jgi:hypothetical protein